jgi:CRISPR-associated endonuclease/helicase Cas3
LDEDPNNKDTDNEVIQKRLNATKRLSIVALGDGEKSDEKLVALAKQKSGQRAVLVFTRSVETATKVAAESDKGEHKGKVTTLTGTMRGKERDELVSKNPVFPRFLRERNLTPEPGTVFLVATSAGEVGVNISADDLICDLSTHESMAQRFGSPRSTERGPVEAVGWAKKQRRVYAQLVRF